MTTGRINQVTTVIFSFIPSCRCFKTTSRNKTKKWSQPRFPCKKNCTGNKGVHKFVHGKPQQRGIDHSQKAFQKESLPQEQALQQRQNPNFE